MEQFPIELIGRISQECNSSSYENLLSSSKCIRENLRRYTVISSYIFSTHHGQKYKKKTIIRSAPLV